VRADEADVDHSVRAVYSHDEAILVPRDVEHDSIVADDAPKTAAATCAKQSSCRLKLFAMLPPWGQEVGPTCLSPVRGPAIPVNCRRYVLSACRRVFEPAVLSPPAAKFSNGVDPPASPPIIPPPFHASGIPLAGATISALARAFGLLVMNRSTLQPDFAEQLNKGPYASNSHTPTRAPHRHRLGTALKVTR